MKPFTSAVLAMLTCIVPLSAAHAQSTDSIRPGQTGTDLVSGSPRSFLPRSEATVDRMKAMSTEIAGRIQPPTDAARVSTASVSNGPQAGPLGPGPGCNLFPAPPSVGASVPLTYFGPNPSTVNPSFVGPVQLLKSGVVDVSKGTLTLPLYKGYLKGTRTPIWYILTDVSDSDVADELGLNFSTKLKSAAPGARTAKFNSNGDLIFNGGTVDFTPDRVLVPGAEPNPFPPITAKPGARGDRNYSPFVRVLNAGGVIYNASIVASGPNEASIDFPKGNPDYSRVHDEVLAIDPYNQVVTLQLVNGFSFGRPLWYVSLDASTELVSAIESNTYAPRLARLATGGDDSFASAVERIFINTNGVRNCADPRRQGLGAALTDGHRPNNTFGGIPTIALDYSPAWNGQLYEWTPDAVKKGYRQQLREEFQILTYADDGLITGPGGTPFGDSGFTINCPPVQRLD